MRRIRNSSGVQFVYGTIVTSAMGAMAVAGVVGFALSIATAMMAYRRPPTRPANDMQ